MNSHSTPQPSVPEPEDAGDAPPGFPFAILFCVWTVVLLIATIVTFILPESFSSTVRIKVERDRSDIPGLAEREPPFGYDPYFIQTEFELIQSEVILQPVIEVLDLNREWGKKYANGERLRTPETLPLLKAKVDLRPVRNTSIIEIRVFRKAPSKLGWF